MKRRSYEQYCGLATAFDLIGERWSALIIRDLAVRPRRFTDLLEGLKGLGTSLLSERLRHLEDVGLIQRVVKDRSAGGGVAYELTDDGQRVALALAPLAMWGATRVEGGHDDFRPDWLIFVLKAAFKPELASGVDDCYEFTIDGHTLWIVVSGGRIDIVGVEPRPADFGVTLSLPTLAAIGAGLVDPMRAAADGTIEYRGDPEAGLRAMQLLGAAMEAAPPARKPAGRAPRTKKAAPRPGARSA